MRSPSLRTSIVVIWVSCLFLAAGVGVWAQQGPAPKGGERAGEPPASDIEALARQQLALIDQAQADLSRMILGGEKSHGDPSFALWARRRLDAVRASGVGRREMVAELEKYAALMKQYEEVAQRRFEKDVATRLDVDDARYLRLEAELMLIRERAR